MVTTVDARGLACPLPLALAKARITQVAPGQRLMVLADDPEAPLDLAAWCAEEGHSLSQEGVEFTILRAST
ncbi:MAG: sulfurtransferase TusA family protein [Thermoleophilaceae bacterium]|nr:sulfurtransferase TusA family protein [Thermoleophilaceae bacterium]